MFIVKKIVAPFLLPPGIFVVLLILSAVWFLFKKDFRAAMVNLLIGLFMWALSISPVSDVLLGGLEFGFEIPGNPQGDVVVVLGGGVYETAPDLSGLGAPSAAFLERIVTAARLQKRLQIPIIVSGGKTSEQSTPEAPIGKRILVDLGVSPDDIITEEKSRDTFENAIQVAVICRKFGFKSPILVTSASHMYRSVMSFEKAGLGVLPFPAGFRSWQGKQYAWTDYLPGPFENLTTALKEYLGFLFYKLTY